MSEINDSNKQQESPEVFWKTIYFLQEEKLREPECAAMTPPLREAHVLDHILSRMPIHIEREQSLAGDLYFSNEAWTRSQELCRQVRDWNSTNPQGSNVPSSAEKMAQWFHCFGGFGGGHTTVDYPKVLHKGFEGILTEIDEQKQANEYLQAMTSALKAVVHWANRYADLAETLAREESCELERKRLGTIAETCRRVPRLPARTFHEALQSIWFIHAVTTITERTGASMSWGRFDQYLYPYFLQKNDSAAIEQCLSDFFKKINTAVLDGAQALNLGPAGSDALYNSLSSMIVRVAKRLHLPAPLLAVRIGPHTPDTVFDELIDPDLFQMGQPTFYGEDSCRRTLVRRNVPEKVVSCWAVNSCMGLIMPGEEISDMWAAVVNLLLPLELTMNNGKPFHKPMPIPMKTVAQAAYGSFDQFLHTFEGYLREIIDYCIDRNHESTLETARRFPNPFLSALIGGCIEKRCDRLASGARYHTKIVEAFGLVNVSDALGVIKRLVFDQRHYSLAELRDAAKNNFKDSGLLLNEISSIPKYGNDDPDADGMASTLARMFARNVTRTLEDIYCYVPSFHTLNVHIGAGSKMAASLDGRLEGEPLAKNIGTRPGISQQGLTALMRSATTIDQTSFAGGQALDISVDSNTIRTPEGRRKFQALLNTYFQLGGLQVQVNALSPQILRQAMKVPESHRDLLVRIAGYTDRFVRLDPSVQKEMIHRFENGL